MANPKKLFTPEQRVLRFIREQFLVMPGQKVVVAVSGGPDSVCLLHILWKLREELAIKLHVAHLNHQLRGGESDADASYVADLAQKLKIPATIASRDVKAYRARHHLSLEEAAREVRYSFLATVAAEAGAERVAVGHTADDHVETILMHLVRGSGTAGLRGLLPLNTIKTGGQELMVVRPLLELTREETAAYCRQHRLRPRTDSSNLSAALFRNKIRHELVPLLQSYNPQATEALRRTARIVVGDVDFIEKEASRRYDKVIRQEGRAIIFNKKKLLALPDALKRQILRRATCSLLGDLKDIEAKHIEDVINALEKPAGRVIGLPEGLKFTIGYDSYTLAPESAPTCPFPTLKTEYDLHVPGRTPIPGGEITASLLSAAKTTEKYGEGNGLTAFFDFAKTGSALKLRRRAPGDRFQPLGMPGPKKLNVFMIDARIPRAWRDRIPIVTSPGQIIWVAGWRIDERVKVTRQTERILRLEYKPI
jgi:tRNA(Ile)-lysidine synthase